MCQSRGVGIGWKWIIFNSFSKYDILFNKEYNYYKQINQSPDIFALGLSPVSTVLLKDVSLCTEK